MMVKLRKKEESRLASFTQAPDPLKSEPCDSCHEIPPPPSIPPLLNLSLSDPRDIPQPPNVTRTPCPPKLPLNAPRKTTPAGPKRPSIKKGHYSNCWCCGDFDHVLKYCPKFKNVPSIRLCTSYGRHGVLKEVCPTPRCVGLQQRAIALGLRPQILNTPFKRPETPASLQKTRVYEASEPVRNKLESILHQSKPSFLPRLPTQATTQIKEVETPEKDDQYPNRSNEPAQQLSDSKSSEDSTEPSSDDSMTTIDYRVIPEDLRS